MNWKVVLIEDEDLLRNGLIQAIPWEELGFEVVGDADNGRKGMELIMETHPDVVFSDIRMAQMDGLTMAEKIREWDPKIRIVFISGYDDFSYARRALKVGAVEYILKPIRLEEVKETLRKLAEILEKEKIQKQKYDKLSRLEKSNTERDRQEFYRSVIYSSGTARQEKKEIYSLPEEELEQFFSVMIIERKDFPLISMNADYIEIMELDHAFEGMLTAVLGEDPDYTMVRGSACERILVFHDRDKKEVQKKLQRTQSALLSKEEAEGISCQTDEGTVEFGPEGLYQSYLAARKAGEKRYQEEWNQIFPGKGETTEPVNFINYDKEPLMQAVRSGNREQIEEECGRLEEELSNRKVFSHMHLILIVTGIFEELLKLPEEIGRIPETACENPMDDYQKIISRGKRAEILSGLKEYCLMLGSCFGETRETRIQSSLKRAISYMNQEYHNDQLMMADVAKYAYVSSSYLSMILKKETGKTFIECLTDIRMEHAKKLLLETEMKNYEVAQACGFANATYFSTVFKSVYGVSPSAYRREAEENNR